MCGGSIKTHRNIELRKIGKDDDDEVVQESGILRGARNSVRTVSIPRLCRCHWQFPTSVLDRRTDW